MSTDVPAESVAADRRVETTLSRIAHVAASIVFSQVGPIPAALVLTLAALIGFTLVTAPSRRP